MKEWMSRMVSRRSLERGLTVLLLLAPVAMQAQTAASLAKIVDAHYNHLQSLETHYTERYRGMGLDRSESGTLTLRKPGRMRWAYDEPAGKLFVLDGKYAITYTPGDAQATRIPAKQLDDLHSPLRFLLGHTELAKELNGLSLTLVSPGIYSLWGTPKGMEQRVREIALTVDAHGEIHAMHIAEVDGSTTDFTFSDMKENVPTTDAEFTFTPPAGVAVVDGTTPM